MESVTLTSSVVAGSGYVAKTKRLQDLNYRKNSTVILSPNFTKIHVQFPEKLTVINLDHQMTMLQTFSFHAHRQTFLIATVLAAITLSLVDNAVLFISACILQLFAHCTLEETLAAFTTVKQTHTSQIHIVAYHCWYL